MKEKAIILLIKKGISSINKNVDLHNIIAQCDDEDRTLNFEIIDSQNIITGFGLRNGRMEEIGLIRDPTVTLKTTKDTFLALCLQKITIEEAIIYGDAELVGESWLRDFRIFQPIFKGFSKVLSDVVPSNG